MPHLLHYLTLPCLYRSRSQISSYHICYFTFNSEVFFFFFFWNIMKNTKTTFKILEYISNYRCLFLTRSDYESLWVSLYSCPPLRPPNAILPRLFQDTVAIEISCKCLWLPSYGQFLHVSSFTGRTQLLTSLSNSPKSRNWDAEL